MILLKTNKHFLTEFYFKIRRFRDQKVIFQMSVPSKAQIDVCLYFVIAFKEAHGTNVSLTKSKTAHCPW